MDISQKRVVSGTCATLVAWETSCLSIHSQMSLGRYKARLYWKAPNVLSVLTLGPTTDVKPTEIVPSYQATV